MRSDTWTKMRVEEKDGNAEEVSERQAGAGGRGGAVRRKIWERDVNTEAGASTRHRGNLGN